MADKRKLKLTDRKLTRELEGRSNEDTLDEIAVSLELLPEELKKVMPALDYKVLAQLISSVDNFSTAVKDIQSPVVNVVEREFPKEIEVSNLKDFTITIPKRFEISNLKDIKFPDIKFPTPKALDLTPVGNAISKLTNALSTHFNGLRDPKRPVRVRLDKEDLSAIIEAQMTFMGNDGGGGSGGGTVSGYVWGTTKAAEHLGTLAFGVRQDTLSTVTEDDGEYTSYKVDSLGALWTRPIGSQNQSLQQKASTYELLSWDSNLATVFGTASLINSGRLKVEASQLTSPWVVSLASTTITGTVAVTQSTSPWVVSGTVAVTATDLDIRDLVYTQDSVRPYGSQSQQFQQKATTFELLTWDDNLATVFGTSSLLSSGRLKTEATQGTTPWAVAGNVASGATDSGNPVKIGALYSTTPPTFTNGQRGDLQMTSRGSLAVTLMGDDNITAIATNSTNTDTAGTSSSSLQLVVNAVQRIYNGTNFSRVYQAVQGLNSTGTGIPLAGLVGIFDDTSPQTVTENQFGNLRMSAKGVLYGTIRDAAGNERGANVDASNRLAVIADQNGSNWSVNVAQMNGTAVTMGNGAAGTGVQRVTIANDSTGVLASITTSIIPGTSATHLGKAVDSAVGATDTGVAALFQRVDTLATITPAVNDYTRGLVNSRGALWVKHDSDVTVQGSQARDAAISSNNPVLIGGRGSDVIPSAVSADGDVVDTTHTRKGIVQTTTAVGTPTTESEDCASASTTYRHQTSSLIAYNCWIEAPEANIGVLTFGGSSTYANNFARLRPGERRFIGTVDLSLLYFGSTFAGDDCIVYYVV